MAAFAGAGFAQMCWRLAQDRTAQRQPGRPARRVWAKLNVWSASTEYYRLLDQATRWSIVRTGETVYL